MKESPRHTDMNQFNVTKNCLEIGGVALPRLAMRVGQTPFYAYDREVISQRVAKLRQSLPEKLSLHYAIKANPMPAVVHHLAQLTDGLDVASIGEMRVALDTGIAADKISFAGPGKTLTELQAAVAAKVMINLESATEMERTAAIGDKLSIQPLVSIRVNPDFELKSSGMKMSGGPKPFGVDAEHVPQMLKRAAQLNLDWRGFHIFCGSQNLRENAIIEAQTRTFELATRLCQHAPNPITWLNIGGGLGIPYFPGEQRLDLGPIADNLAQLMAQSTSALSSAEIVMELGRYLVGEAGIYVCKVIDIKQSRGQAFAITDGGLHHHLSASGNFGQVIRKNYPACVGNKVHSDTLTAVNVVGPLCTPLDILADKINLPELEIDDLIVIFQSGAYGLTASPTAFLGHAPPQEVLV